MLLPLTPAASDLKHQLTQQRNWQDTYRQLLLAARQQPPLDPAACNERHRVDGCEAKVWLQVSDANGQLNFTFASESRMVYALTYAALLPLQGQPPSFATNFDIQDWLQQCNLSHQLAPSRSNGLYQIIRRAQQLAQTFR